MTKRRSLLISLALIVVIVLTLSGFRGQQAWSESRAQADYTTARNDAHATIARAARAGVLSAQLASYRARAQHIDSVSAPRANLLWDTASTRFYVRQSTAYRHLTAAVLREQRIVTRQTRLQAEKDVAALKHAIAQARVYGLDVQGPSITLSRESTALSGLEGTASATPAEYRFQSAKTAPMASYVENQVAQRAAYVSALVRQAGGSISAIQGGVDSEASTAEEQLDLYALFSRQAAGYVSAVKSLQAAAHAQRTPEAAAVEEALLHDEVGVISAAVNRSVPSKVIVVSTEGQWVHLYQNGVQIYSTVATTGGPELPTSHGTFHIYEKISPFVFHSPWPPSSPFYYSPSPVTYWMPFDGGEGLHDAPWRSNFGPGSNVQPTDLGGGRYILGTHGCVNLPNDAAAYIWDWAPMGTTVVVI